MATLPTYNKPSFKSLGSYNAPTWDEDEIDALTQKRASMGVRALRNEMQRTGARSYGSPQVTKMTLRDALQGYGAGLDKVMSGASSAAQSEYGTKYGYSVDNAQSTYSAGAANATARNAWARDNANMEYEAAWKAYDTENADDWEAKMEKEYDIWKRKSQYTKWSEAGSTPYYDPNTGLYGGQKEAIGPKYGKS